MLATDRLDAILKMVNAKGSVMVQEIIEQLEISESTVRRDLNMLDKKGLLIKVHGGAVSLVDSKSSVDSNVLVREDINREDKLAIAKHAASLIEPGDFIYLDAGTSTGFMIDFITEKNTTFITNAFMHAKRLVSKGFKVYLPGGELKAVTEALIGAKTTEDLQRYRFTKGFFGTNGIDLEYGFTTPDIREGKVKECAIRHCERAYILADTTKFSKISPVKFADYDAASIIVNRKVDEKYRKRGNIIEIS
ncbi:DeoR/GlpR family DNA-binding transcription regulator [Clostridium sp. AM58-1XD]|uniref:DeoR/GlpR family DNA-binding transcription regulator n=1 Tax=Clostridium sp. AM58-1XD TaxID=2292307 RepID=UPI000E550B19|nr:DeoR/GlpR family DNA-binding transcription regulator [Clostridium sp. AM58-1XD]RGZ01559.1 DeoR/GlpR transcriptional regulator [Clostridium sp. AM58-1XD]